MKRAPDDVLSRGTQELIDNGVRAALAQAYRAGARNALNRLRNQVEWRIESVHMTMNDNNRGDDPYLLGVEAGHAWTLEAAKVIIDEYKEES